MDVVEVDQMWFFALYIDKVHICPSLPMQNSLSYTKALPRVCTRNTKSPLYKTDTKS